jgi:serine/threonine-protein kinase
VAAEATTRSYLRVCDLAEGGMGVVELVVRREGRFQRWYARKRLQAQHRNDPQFRTMFTDEARLAGLVRHRNVVSVLDVGEDDEGPYLVMDLVEGQAVARVIGRARERGEPVPVQVAVRVGLEAARGLHAAHEARGPDGAPLHLVHRDMSPQNILIGYDGGVRVTDFGIAKAYGNAARTVSGVLKGNMGYLSPEQLRFEEPDRRSDLFSLGVTLYELLTGERLYANREGFDGTRRILNEPAPDLRARRPDVPDALAELLLALMAKDREQRPQTADEVTRRLETILAPLVEAEGTLDLGDYIGRRFAPERAALQRLLESHAAPEDEPAPPAPVRSRRRLWVAVPAALLLAALVVWRARVPAQPPRPTRALWAGAAGTCRVEGRSLRCWGSDDVGQLAGRGLPDAVSVALGRSFGCACVRDGRALCWGRNDHGQVGNPAAGAAAAVPTQVDGIDDCAQVAAGTSHACVARRDGTVACWGDNSADQVASGAGHLIPAAAAVRGLERVVEVAAGEELSCARLATGAVWCWGRNQHGQVALPPSPAERAVRAVAGVSDAVELALGERFACARTAAGRVLCWGVSPADAPDARPHGPIEVKGIADADHIAAGRAHVCALRRGGALACWGANDAGQLGDGSTRATTRPVTVAATEPFLAVAAGDAHTCARRAAGIWCWGANDRGQLGDGSTRDQPRPVAVAP